MRFHTCRAEEEVMGGGKMAAVKLVASSDSEAPISSLFRELHGMITGLPQFSRPNGADYQHRSRQHEPFFDVKLRLYEVWPRLLRQRPGHGTSHSIGAKKRALRLHAPHVGHPQNKSGENTVKFRQKPPSVGNT